MEAKRITTKEEMVQWAREVNNGLSTKQKCDYQDIWARSERDTLDKLFIESNGERNLIVCSVHNTMAYDEIEHLLKTWAVYQANKVVEKEMEACNNEWNKRQEVVTAQENALYDAKKSYWKRIIKLRRAMSNLVARNSYLQTDLDNCRKVNARLCRENGELKDKASRYDGIKSLLA